MKKLLLFVKLALLSSIAFANHITGGEMYYVWKSQNGNNHTYDFTLKLFRDCNPPQGSADLDGNVIIGIYNNTTNTLLRSINVNLTERTKENLGSPNPCISNPPTVCYDVGYYRFTETLPASANGYTITYQRCCRITGINNILPNSNQHGATYTAQIPGTSSLPTAPVNTSAKFLGIDTVIVCAGNYFCYNFGAADADGDELRYSFCNAFLGGSQGNSIPNPPTAPPYNTVPYQSPYNSSQPLGPNVTVDPSTGMMCGTAPTTGIYVVTVCVGEYRNGVLIATQRKDLQIKIGDCNVAKSLPAVFDELGARIKPEAAGCRSFTYRFANDIPPNPLIHSYYWEFSDGATYTTANPAHTFADTGVYTIKLVVNRGEQCGDSATSILRVYPGFNPDFTISGICVNKPIRFTDATTTRFGVVNSWRWDFGNTAATNDTSRLRNPTYTYPLATNYNASLIVTTDKGCIDTVRKPIDILTKPPLSVATRDTLICNGDSVQLHAVGLGNFSWTPATRIVGGNTAHPTVFPTVTTNYVVQLDDQGCQAFDTVRVRVVNFVTLTAMPDTTICATDTLRLYSTGDGLRFLWSPAATLNDATLARPVAKPAVTTNYTLESRIGKCVTTDEVRVTVVPYPVASAGPDTIICFNSSTQLRGTHDGTSFSWSPAASLTGATTLTPTARPTVTTAYVLTSFDTRGCPKPGRDTVLVTVNPQVFAYAGRDTAVVAGQGLQFTATGGESYAWSPSTGLNNVSIANPVGTYDGSFDSIRYEVEVRDAAGCAEMATVMVKIFKTAPRVFVPTAFTPNGDGRNDVVRPIAVGLTNLEYFRIFNRWGQLVFETTVNGKGWNGKLKGTDQGSGSYVWIVKGKDFTGKTVFEKGMVTLIR
jgi:gliding motility-associated-like protein